MCRQSKHWNTLTGEEATRFIRKLIELELLDASLVRDDGKRVTVPLDERVQPLLCSDVARAIANANAAGSPPRQPRGAPVVVGVPVNAMCCDSGDDSCSLGSLGDVDLNEDSVLPEAWLELCVVPDIALRSLHLAPAHEVVLPVALPVISAASTYAPAGRRRARAAEPEPLAVVPFCTHHLCGHDEEDAREPLVLPALTKAQMDLTCFSELRDVVQSEMDVRGMNVTPAEWCFTLTMTLCGTEFLVPLTRCEDIADCGGAGREC